jgi:hypothetical protein
MVAVKNSASIALSSLVLLFSQVEREGVRCIKAYRDVPGDTTSLTTAYLARYGRLVERTTGRL